MRILGIGIRRKNKDSDTSSPKSTCQIGIACPGKQEQANRERHRCELQQHKFSLRNILVINLAFEIWFLEECLGDWSDYGLHDDDDEAEPYTFRVVTAVLGAEYPDESRVEEVRETVEVAVVCSCELDY